MSVTAPPNRRHQPRAALRQAGPTLGEKSWHRRGTEPADFSPAHQRVTMVKPPAATTIRTVEPPRDCRSIKKPERSYDRTVAVPAPPMDTVRCSLVLDFDVSSAVKCPPPSVRQRRDLRHHQQRVDRAGPAGGLHGHRHRVRAHQVCAGRSAPARSATAALPCGPTAPYRHVAQPSTPALNGAPGVGSMAPTRQPAAPDAVGCCPAGSTSPCSPRSRRHTARRSIATRPSTPSRRGHRGAAAQRPVSASTTCRPSRTWMAADAWPAGPGRGWRPAPAWSAARGWSIRRRSWG